MFTRANEIESINIELTNLCNLSCKMCYRNRMKNIETGVMSFENFITIVNKISSQLTNLNVVYLHWRGEPTLVDYLIEAIIYIKQEMPVKLVLFTNGTKLDQIGKELLDTSIDKVFISMDASRNELLEKIRIGINAESLFENIRNFVQLRDSGNYKTEINISSVVLEENIFEVFNIKKLWEDTVDNIIFKRDTTNVVQEKKKGLTCSWPITNLVVGWNGNVFPCCSDVEEKYELGNIIADELEVIIKGKKYLTFMKNMRNINNEPLICTGCNISKNIEGTKL